MIDQGFAAARMLFSIVLNAVGLVGLIAAAWFMPHVLQLIVSAG